MNLTPEQQQAVDSTAPLICLSACAGSGKTTVLIERVRRLIAQGTAPARIAMVTYTTSAARHMRERLVCDTCQGTAGNLEWHNDPVNLDPHCHACNGMGYVPLGFCGTLHSLCLMLVQRHHALIGYGPNVHVLSQPESDELLSETVKEHGYKGTKDALKVVLDAGPQWLLAYRGEQVGSKMDHLQAILVAKAYWRKLQEQNALDYDLVLHMGKRVIEQGVDVGYDVLIVDEFQDVARIDMEIYKALSIPSKMFCGDFNQAIFSFRHPNEEPVRHHYELAYTDTGVQSLALHGSFRCARSICSAANKLLGGNMVSLRTDCPVPEPEQVSRHGFPDMEAEVQFIYSVAKLGVEHYSDMAVLCRYNKHVEQYSAALTALGVPCVTNRAAQVPQDWALAQKLVSFMAHCDSDRGAYAYLEAQQGANVAQAAKNEAIQHLASINQTTLHFEHMLPLSDWRDIFLECGISDVTQGAVEQIMEQLPDANHAQLLAAMREAEYAPPPEQNAVTVCTIHGSKSREWKTVVLPAFEQGILPKGTDPEELRLCYVALTRAADHVLFTHCAERQDMWSGELRKQEPSEFLKLMELL